MKILVSACLLGRNCKYSGGNNLSGAVTEFVKDKDVIEVCPEVLAGLGIPRMPMEIVDGSLTIFIGIPSFSSYIGYIVVVTSVPS